MSDLTVSAKQLKLKKNGVFVADLFKHLPTFVGPSLFGGSLYALGLAIFYRQGSPLFFLTSIPLGIIIFGITSVLLAGDWAYRVYAEIYQNAASIFDLRLAPGDNFLEDKINSIQSDRNILLFASPVIFSFELYFFEMKFKIYTVPSRFYSIVYGHLSTQIYFAVSMALIGYVLGLAIFIVVMHVLFVHSLSRHTLHPISVHYSRLKHETSKLKEIRDLLMLSLKASLAWSTGVADLAILFISLGNIEAATTLAIVISAAVAGIVLFSLPQLDLRVTISALKKEERKEILQKYNIPESEDPSRVKLPQADWIQLHMELEHLERLEEWPIHYTVIIEEVVITMIPVFVNYAGQAFLHP